MRKASRPADEVVVTAIAETASFAFAGAPGLVIRRVLALLAACVVLVVGVSTALGAGAWNGGVDSGRFFSADAPAHVAKPATVSRHSASRSVRGAAGQ
jgi:hypothetical protein